MLAMLRAGTLDAVIVGNDPPQDPGLHPVFPDPDAAAAAFWAYHRLVPINHMFTVTRDLAQRRPDLVATLLAMFGAARMEVPERARLPIGRAALQPAMDLALRYTAAHGLLPHSLTGEDIWECYDPAPAGQIGS